MSGAPVGPRFFGHHRNGSALETIVGGTTVLSATSSAVTLTGTLTTSGALTVTAGGLTVTAGSVAFPAGSIAMAALAEGSMRFVDTSLTNAAVKAFRATPAPVVAAPGANKAIVVHSIYIVSDDSAGAWTESTDNLVLEYAGGADITAAIEAGTLVGGGVQVQKQGVLDTVITPETNAAVELFNTGDGEWAGGNAANTMSVRVFYSVVDTVAFT